MTKFDDLLYDASLDRFKGKKRDYTPEDVKRLRGSVQIRHTLAEKGAKRLWESINKDEPVRALGALTGNQAMQMAKAGLDAIYLSGWQVAADANLSGNMYPDQSLYPANSAPELVRRINNTLRRADQIQTMEGQENLDYFLPIIADAEAGFGGALNAFEIMKSFIEAGAAAAHFEDQLASEKKCGHLGGKVLIPTKQHIKNLSSARLAADISGTQTIIISRTDAESAKLITTSVDERDQQFISDERTSEGFYRLKEGTGVDHCIARAKSCAPYADLIWMETSTPCLETARRFSESVRKDFPDQIFAYNCSPSFNWKANLGEDKIAKFQRELGAMGFKFQFITLAGFHNLNYGMFQLAKSYKEDHMTAYSILQQAEFAAEKDGYTATRHQREVGTGYFDEIARVVSGGKSSTTAMGESTETDQFKG